LSHVENINLDSVAARPRPCLSLTLWLALSMSFAAFFLLALISFLLYLGLAAQLRSQNHFYLHDEVNILVQMIRSENNDAPLSAEMNSDQHGEEYVKHYIRLLNRNEVVIQETRAMDVIAPHDRFTAPVRDGLPGVDSLWRTPKGNMMLGTAEWVDLGKMSGEQGLLEVALDVTNVQNILEGYRHKIYGALFVGFFLCIAVSLAIARRGTRPLREMTEMVNRISASALDERISGENWPSELKVLADATNLMLDRLQGYFERLYDSARNLSHKMRTPLTIMKGEAEVALSRERTVEELQDVIVSGLEENRRLVRLVDSILFLSDAEIGKFQYAPCELDADREIEKVLDFYSPLAEDREVAMTCQGSACLFADASLFRKAVAALISNALTYNTPGGSVDLLLSQGEGLSGKLSVTDSGCGFGEAEKQKVFDRFYRIYGTRHRDPHGTGLGLPTVKAIMDLHNGSVEVQSVPDKGTTVTLNFPGSAVQS
jgi:two-component system, OmpR family, heavy metal sensor histidine kinase CusS